MRDVDESALRVNALNRLFGRQVAWDVVCQKVTDDFTLARHDLFADNDRERRAFL